jgi:hypothetical protein
LKSQNENLQKNKSNLSLQLEEALSSAKQLKEMETDNEELQRVLEKSLEELNCLLSEKKELTDKLKTARTSLSVTLYLLLYLYISFS